MKDSEGERGKLRKRGTEQRERERLRGRLRKRGRDQREREKKTEKAGEKEKQTDVSIQTQSG